MSVSSSIVEDRAVDERAAADVLGLKPSTLASLRSRGGGPRFVRIGTMVRYRLSDLHSWLAARVVESTADVSEAERAAIGSAEAKARREAKREERKGVAAAMLVGKAEAKAQREREAAAKVAARTDTAASSETSAASPPKARRATTKRRGS